ncbi:MAG: oligopeptide/dipeptide ABC transporter ATP-binding protein, partial [Acidimicrobiales bacterium]
TQLLVSAAPDPDAAARGERQRTRAAGENPSLIDPPSGCRFHPRCPHAMEICSKERPPHFSINDAHWAACWLYRDATPPELDDSKRAAPQEAAPVS